VSNVIHPTEGLIQTVRIECTLTSGKTSVGTGFLYAFMAGKFDDNRSWAIRAIVTNKHVIEKEGIRAKSGHFYFNKMDKSGKCLYGEKVRVEFNGEEWMHHPSKEVDLSILPVGNKIKKIEERGERLFLSSNLYEIVPANKQEWTRVGPLEDIVTIGYPNGLWDENNNMPISRKGITATYANVNYRGKEEFLVDIPIFPGISGSPVIAYSYGNEFYESGGWGVGGKCLFIGIVYARLKYRKGEAGADMYLIPTDDRKADLYELMSDLAVAIKSTKLKDFEKILEPTLDEEDKKYIEKIRVYNATKSKVTNL
jgi:hypothetical protein